MNTPTRLVEMLLRGKTDQFKTVMKEELVYRTTILMEKLYKNISENIIKEIKEIKKPVKVDNAADTKKITKIVENKELKFIPESTYYLRDGNLGVLNETDKQLISKLYEKLNNINKERMIKLLSESKESFNRILNLAKAENKK